MEMFYNEATKSCEGVDECQSPGLGPTEQSFDLTSLILGGSFENSVFTLPSSQDSNSNSNIHHLIDEDLIIQPNNNNIDPTTPHTSSHQLTTTPIIENNPNIPHMPQLKLEESINLTSISQTSLLSGGESSLNFSVKEEPDCQSNRRRRKTSESDDVPDYRNKRNRNNIAVRKSREKAKEQQQRAKERVDSLRQENKMLETKVAQLQTELKFCQSMFVNARIDVPQVLQDVLKKI